MENNYSVEFNKLSTSEKYKAAGVSPTILGGEGDGIDIGIGVFGKRDEYLRNEYIKKREAQASFLGQQESSYNEVLNTALEQAQNPEDIAQLGANKAMYELGLGLMGQGDPRGVQYMADAIADLNSHSGTQEVQRLGREADEKARQLVQSKELNAQSDALNQQFRKQITPLREGVQSMGLIDELSKAESPLAAKMIVTKIARLMQGSGALSDSDIQAVQGATGTWLESVDQMLASGVDGAGMTPEARNSLIKALQPYADKIQTQAAEVLGEYVDVAQARGLDQKRVLAGVNLEDFEAYGFEESDLGTPEEQQARKIAQAASREEKIGEGAATITETGVSAGKGVFRGFSEGTGLAKVGRGIGGLVADIAYGGGPTGKEVIEAARARGLEQKAAERARYRSAARRRARRKANRSEPEGRER